jgi:hypothetical protein
VDEERNVSLFFPAASEERWLAAADLAGERAVSVADTGGWRSASLFARAAFFFLGLLAAGAMLGLMYMMTNSVKGAGVVTAVVCIAVAELLITKQRFFGMGIEEALWLFGAFCVLPATLDGNQRAVALGIAIACGAAALRLWNPLFTTFAIAAAGWRLGLEGGWPLASAICWIAGACAWLALRKSFVRPSTQRFFEWMAVVLPLAAYLFAKRFDFDPWRLVEGRMSFESMTELAMPLLLAIGAAIALRLGLRWRQHALLLAFALWVTLLGVELRELSGLALETKLIVYGVIVLVASTVIERRLRRASGVTSLPFGRDSDAWKLLEIGTAATLATTSHHHDRQPPETGVETGGGSFGGAGSSGRF